MCEMQQENFSIEIRSACQSRKFPISMQCNSVLFRCSLSIRKSYILDIFQSSNASFLSEYSSETHSEDKNLNIFEILHDIIEKYSFKEPAGNLVVTYIRVSCITILD